MKKTDSLFNKNLPPLAERVRPKTIDNFIGQDHLIGPNKIINQMLSKRKYYSIILWGPPGSCLLYKSPSPRDVEEWAF